MMSFDQQRVKLLALPKAAANGERAQCYAMIALTARDQMATLWLAQFNKILPSYLERRLDTLRATAHKEYVAKPERRMGNEVVCQIFRSLRGKEARIYGLLYLSGCGRSGRRPRCPCASRAWPRILCERWLGGYRGGAQDSSAIFC